MFPILFCQNIKTEPRFLYYLRKHPAYFMKFWKKHWLGNFPEYRFNAKHVTTTHHTLPLNLGMVQSVGHLSLCCSHHFLHLSSNFVPQYYLICGKSCERCRRREKMGQSTLTSKSPNASNILQHQTVKR